MKKTLLVLIAFTTTVLFAQEKSSDSTKTPKNCIIKTYIGFNGHVNDNLNLNKKLRNSNLPEMNSFVPEFTLGLNFFGKKYSGNFEFGFMFSKPEEGNNEMKYRGYNSRLRLHYNLVDKEKFAFTSGLSFAFTGNEYDIYSKDNTIDLNNLEPNNNAGHVNFSNQMFYVGPSASVYLFKKTSMRLRLNVGYELAITRGRYRSEYGSILNNINESGNNRFIFGISLL